MQYLQKRLRTLEGENTSLEQVVSRLKIDAEAATRRASQAEQARLETAEQLRNSLRTKEQHEHQMQQVQEVNLLRESNVTLRLLQRRRSAHPVTCCALPRCVCLEHANVHMSWLLMAPFGIRRALHCSAVYAGTSFAANKLAVHGCRFDGAETPALCFKSLVS